MVRRSEAEAPLSEGAVPESSARRKAAAARQAQVAAERRKRQWLIGGAVAVVIAVGVNCDGQREVLGLDVERVLRRAGKTERRVARLLMEYTPTEVGRRLDFARSTVYVLIGRLRMRFERAGLHPQG